MKNKIKFYTVLITISVLITAIWFKDGKMLATGESGLPFYNTEQLLNLQKNTWSEGAIGLPSGSTLSSYPFYWTIIQFQRLHIPDAYMQAIFFFFCLAISKIYLIKILKMFVEDDKSESYAYYFISALLYATNLFALVNVWNRFQYTFIIFYSLLPFIMYSSLRFVRDRILLAGLFLVIVLTFFSFAFSSIPLLLLVWGTILLVGLFEISVHFSGRKVGFIGFGLVALLILWCGANSWWLLPFITTLRSSTYLSQQAYNSEGNLRSFLQMSENLGNLSYLFRLMHKDFFNNIGSIWGYLYVKPLGIILTYIPVFLTFYPLTKKLKNRYLYFFIAIALVGLFFAKGSAPPFGFIFIFLFEHVKILEAFRNPFEKIGLFVPIAYAILSAYSLHTITRNWDTKIKFTTLTLGGILLVLIIPYPFWNGTVFAGTVAPQNNPAIGYKIEVPSYISDANRYLKNDSGDFRTIALPFSGEGINYNWRYGYAGVDIYNGLLSRPSISFSTAIQFYAPIADQMEKMVIKFPDSLENTMRLLNAKYLIIRNDVDYKARGLTNPQQISNAIQKAGKLTNVHNFGKLNLYSSFRTEEGQKIYAASNIIQYSNNEEYLFTNILPYSSYNPGDIFVKIKDTPDLVQNYVKQKMYTPVLKVYDEKLETLNVKFVPLEKTPVISQENALRELPYVSILPDSWLYFFVRLRESMLTVYSKKSWSDKQFDTLRFAGKRLVEIYKLIQKNPNSNKLEQVSAEYYAQLEEIDPGYILSSEGIPRELMRHKYVISLIKASGTDISKYPELQKADNYLDTIFNRGVTVRGQNLTVKRSKYQLEVEQEKSYPIYLQLDQGAVFNTKSIKINDLVYPLNNGFLRDNIKLRKGSNTIEIPFDKTNPKIKDELTNISVRIIDNNFTSTAVGPQPEITFKKINSALYTAHISNAQHPFILIFSESFHPLWKAIIDDKMISEQNHFLANSYANAWFVTKQGSYDMTIKFSAEDSFEFGTKLSVIFLGIIAILTTIKLIPKKKAKE